MAYHRGQGRAPGSGRAAGTKNKFTVSFMEKLTAILNEPETEVRLKELRDSDDASDRRTFWTLAGNRVPKQVEAKIESSNVVRIVNLSGEPDAPMESEEGSNVDTDD